MCMHDTSLKRCTTWWTNHLTRFVVRGKPQDNVGIMSQRTRELVLFFISYKLSQKNYPNCHLWLENERTEDGQTPAAAANGLLNGAGRLEVARSSTDGLDAVRAALCDSADEFELRYTRAFSDLSSQLHITPATAYHSFESVMNEVFRDGVNWGRIVGLFSFGGALCLECVEKDMSPLVPRVADWMTTYLNNHIEPWIRSQGGWESFAEIFGRDAAAEARRSQEKLTRWLLAGVVLLTGVLLGALLAKKRQ